MSKPTFQVLIDCKGRPVDRRFMYYAENIVALVLGADKSQPNFWITRTDIYHEFMEREVYGQPDRGILAERPKVSHEPRHEPSFDLYIDGATVPTARLVNIKIPEVSQ